MTRARKLYVVVVVTATDDGPEGVVYGPTEDKRKASRRAVRLDKEPGVSASVTVLCPL
jgi:hypothetical protein